MEIGDDVKAEAVVSGAANVKGLTQLAGTICKTVGLSPEDQPALASAIELVLEAG
jgi:hypothetical protein